MAYEAPEQEIDIDEGRVVSALEANLIESDLIQGTEVSDQRGRNHELYSLDSLGNEKTNRSQHISGDVLDAVEAQKAYYLETFLSGRNVVKFMPENADDTTSHLATAYVEHMFMHRNAGARLLRDALHDAFVAKRCAVYLYWQDDKSTVTKSFDNLGAPQVQAPQGQMMPTGGTVDARSAGGGPDGQPMFAGEATVEKDTSKVCGELLQPESYFRDPHCSDLKYASYAGWQEEVPRYELIERGFDEEEVMNLRLDYRFRQREEDHSRKSHDGSYGRNKLNSKSVEAESVTVYCIFAYMNLQNYSATSTDDAVEGTKLYKFVFASGQLLTQENGSKYSEVEEYPIIEWTQYPISHSEFGLCEADIQADIQWTKSNLLRMIIDNQAMTNTSRWKARHGFIKNPRELLENNIGSVVWMKDTNADLQPLPTTPISPIAFSVLEGLDREKEQRSGLSSLAKGLNADAVKNQNASDMIERLTNASNRRVMRGVRDFAETFLKPLFIMMYNLGVENDSGEVMTEIAGEFQTLKPSQWPNRTLCGVEVALTPEQAQGKAGFLMQLHQMLSSDPSLQVLYGLEQKHALLDDAAELLGVADTSRYMRQPDSQEVQQAGQIANQKAQENEQMQNQLMAAQMQNQMLQTQLAQAASEREDIKVRLKGLEVQSKVADTGADNVRADDRLEFDKQRAAAEFKLEQTQRRPASI